jgi:hypothetical protein
MSLAQLRAKTDRELSVLVRRELERSLTLASRGCYREAERGYTPAKRLLALIEMAGPERVHLESKLAELRNVLERPRIATMAS